MRKAEYGFDMVKIITLSGVVPFNFKSFIIRFPLLALNYFTK